MAKLINVAHLLSGRPDNIYGGDIVALNILKHIDKNIFKPYLLSFREQRIEGVPLVIKKARELNIETKCILSKSKFDYKSLSKLKTFIEKNNIDILHSHGYKADVFTQLLNAPSIKRVSTMHGWWLGKSLKLKIYNYLDILSIKKFNKVVAVSSEIKNRLIKNIDSKKLIVINNGIDLSEIYSAAKVNLDNEKGVLILATAGRLSGEKGHKYLFEAISSIDSVKLLVIGSGPLEKALKQYITDEKIGSKIVFCGFKDNVLDYINSADVFVLPSISEGLPLALLEAMALKKAVIASDVGEISNIIRDKKNGLLVEAKKPALLKQAIEYLKDNRQIIEKMGQRAHETVRNNYSISKTVTSYQQVYREILNEK